MRQPVIFISYSHKDGVEKDKLVSHLGVLRNNGLIDLWDDERIRAGSHWQEAIDQAISKARVAILLVSADYLNSDFINEREIPQLLERRQNEGLTVFPVIAKSCLWRRVSWLESMQVRPRSGAPVWRDGGAHVDDELTKIADEVADIILSASSDPGPTPSRTPSPNTEDTLPLPVEARSEPGSRRLLMVDDEPIYLRSMKFALEGNNITFFEASTVQDALTQLKKNPDIKVILLDLQLDGGEKGTELLERIKDRASQYKVIIMTAHSEDLPADVAKQYNVFSYHVKGKAKEDGAPALQFEVERAFEDAERSEKATANTFDNMVLDEYPTPFTIIYEELRSHLTFERRFFRIINLFELLMHFSALTILTEYLNDSRRIPELDNVIKQRITKPSLGEWFNLILEILAKKKELQHCFLLDKFSALFKGKNREAMSRMINMRNDHIGHGTAHAEHEYEDLVNDCWQIMKTLLNDFHFIADFLLCYVQGDSRHRTTYVHRLIEYRGRNYNQNFSERHFSSSLESSEILLVHLKTERFLSLSPLVVWNKCSECRQMEVFFYTKLEGDKMQYMSYSSGHKMYIKQYLGDFLNLLDKNG